MLQSLNIINTKKSQVMKKMRRYVKSLKDIVDLYNFNQVVIQVKKAKD